MSDALVPANSGEFLFYRTDDGQTRIQVRLEGETVWLSQKVMAELFQKDVRTISEHIRNIFDEGELQEAAAIRNFRITAADAKQYETQHYNLDVIISVGYRVKSLRGTQFRIWATQRLRELIVKGFTMDDDRLKNAGGGNYVMGKHPGKTWGSQATVGGQRSRDRQGAFYTRTNLRKRSLTVTARNSSAHLFDRREILALAYSSRGSVRSTLNSSD